MKRLVLIDGNALLHRAYHATPPLSTSSGILVNAVYGFTLMLLKALEDLKPDYLAVAWDKKAPTFRHVQFEAYKANRVKTDDALLGQYEVVDKVLKSMDIPQFSLTGFEADDLIGCLAKQAENPSTLQQVQGRTEQSRSATSSGQEIETIILTGDRDLMQLISPKIKVLMPKKTLNDVGLYGEAEFNLRYGFAPGNMTDYKGLAGDPSDNIPGVPGIGEVTATKLIQKYQTLDEVYKHLEEISGRTKDLLEAGKDSAFMSKKLATVECEVPIKLDLEKSKIHGFDKNEAVRVFEELEFKSLIKKIPGIDRGPAAQQPHPMSSLASSLRAVDGAPRFASPLIANSNGVRRQPPSTYSSLSETAKLDKEVDIVLKKMTATGVLIDLDFLSKFGQTLKSRLVKLEQDLYSVAGHEFNPNSPKQLQVVLFDDLKLPVGRKTKTGRSTDEQTLRDLFDAHPIIPLLLEYRQLFKLVSTYVLALPKSVKEDGRIHSTFNVEGAATGRISSQDPNLQNIPVKGETGGEIRKAFIAPKNMVLLGADYSQIELRIMAHLCGDENLIKAFKDGLDIHGATAAKIFNIPIDKVTREQRNIGKTMNFATLYGQGAHALAQQLKVDFATARNYIDDYFLEFPKIKIWKEHIIEEALEKGYSETLWGRRRYFPELKMGNQMMRSFGERAAINHPVQGCLPAEIKILTSGGYISIGELYVAEKKPSFVWDGSGWKSYEVLERGEAQLAMIKFSNGQVFKCDVRHKILIITKNGYQWKEFLKLKAGMKVCFSMPAVHAFSSKQFQYKHVPKVHNGIPLEIIVNKDFWYWLGYYIGDGYMHKRWNRAWVYSLTYFFGDHENEKREECIKFFTSLGLHPVERKMMHRPKVKLSTRYYVTIHSQGLGKLLEEVGFLGGKNAHTKCLSPHIFTESLENRCAFIKGIMDSDGYDGIKESNNPSVHICQRELLQEIQLLLKTVGVESQVRGPYLYNDRVSYRLDIHRNALAQILHQGEISCFDRYLNRITPQFLIQEAVSLGGCLKKAQFATTSDYVLYSRWKNGGSSSLYHFQTWLKRNKVTLQTPVYHFNEITEIEKLNQFETTYTLSVPGSHRFDSEGVISKNTAADMIKKAMVNISQELDKIAASSFDKLRTPRNDTSAMLSAGVIASEAKQSSLCQLILQVHDELLFECDPKCAKEIAKMVKDKMENALKLDVPVIVDLKSGKNWGEMEDLQFST